jgi:replicative DNA helicase
MRVSTAVGKLDTAPLYIDDTASISMMEIRAKCQRLKRQQQDLGLVVVDYIQLMQSSSRRAENRVQEVSEITRGLKILAKELDAPVLAVSQLNRQPEQGGGDRRPQLSHLRDSGSVEQDSDVVMFVYREEYYNPETPAKGEAEIIVAKHRNGPVDTVKLAFLGQYTKFADLARS